MHRSSALGLVGDSEPFATAQKSKRRTLDDGLPANFDAERFVLGSILLDDAQFDLVVSALHIEDFSLDVHRRVFKSMNDVRRTGLAIDRLTLANELKARGELANIGGLTFLTSLDDGMPAKVDLSSYMQLIKEKSRLRKIIAISQNTLNQALSGQFASQEIITKSSAQLEEMFIHDTPARAETKVYTYTELAAANFAPPTPVAEDFLNEGETIGLIGKPKQGKSRLIQQFAIDVCRGRSFLGHAVSKRRRVMILDFENRPAGARDRLMRMDPGTDTNDNLFVYAPESLMANQITLANPDAERALRKIVERHRPEVLIIDNWRLFLAGDENRPEVVIRALKVLSKLREVIPELAIVIVHHMRKQQSGDRQQPVLLRVDPSLWLEAASGHYAFVAHVDSCFGLEREKNSEGDELIIFAGTARNTSARTLILDEDEQTLRFSIADGADVEKVFTNRELELWCAMRHEQAFRFTDLITKTKTTNRKAAASMLRKANDMGLVIKGLDGVYRCANK